MNAQKLAEDKTFAKDTLQIVREHESEFYRWSMRELAPNSAHADTRSMYLRMIPAPITAREQMFDDLRVENWPALDFFPHIASAVRASSSIARVMIVSLKPGGHIGLHRDEGSYADATKRRHVVLQTNPGCRFLVGGEEYHMAAGEFWAFDKSLEHEFFNDGDCERVHLIYDLWKEPA